MGQTMKLTTKKIVQTAVLIALLIVLQHVTKPLGQFVTGSCVNFLLATAVFLCGTWSGVAVALISPFFAFLLGIGTPIFTLVPLIALGNVVFVLLIALFRKLWGEDLVKRILNVVISAVAKFLVLWIAITKIALPLMGLAEKQVNVLSATFSWPQLVTALIGGVLAALLIPRLRKALKQ